MKTAAILAFLLLPAGGAQEERTDVGRLIERLGADFLEEREAARRALRAAGPGAESPLIDALRSGDHRVRESCVELLASLKSARALPKIAAMFREDDDETVRDAAFVFLRARGKEVAGFLGPALDSPRAGRRAEALRSLAEGKVDKFAAKAAELCERDENEAVRGEALRYLLAIGEAAEPHLRKLLRSADTGIRRSALEGLRESASDKTLQAVGAAFLDETDPSLLDAAAGFLKKAGGKAEEIFLKGLRGANEPVRLKSIEGLGGMPALGRPAEEALLGVLSGGDREIRRGAIAALGRAGSAAAVDRLMDLLEDPEMSAAALEALARIGGPAADRIMQAEMEGKIELGTAEVFGEIRVQVEVERVLAGLVDAEGGGGYFEGMFKDVGRVGKERAVPVLLRIIRGRDFPYRFKPASPAPEEGYVTQMQGLAILALGELGVPEAAGDLKEASAGLGMGIYGQDIAVALYRMGDKEPCEDLLRKSGDDADASLQQGDWGSACSLLFSRGIMQSRMGRRDDARESYMKILRIVEERAIPAREVGNYPTTLYNLACLSALQGEKREAIGWLRKAVEAGFEDRAWMRKDRDLESMWGEEDFKTLSQEGGKPPGK